MLRILSSNHDHWVKVLPGVLFAYRTSVQKSTGFTPFYFMYGRQAGLPLKFEASDDLETEDTLAEMIIDDSIENDVLQNNKNLQSQHHHQIVKSKHHQPYNNI